MRSYVLILARLGQGHEAQEDVLKAHQEIVLIDGPVVPGSEASHDFLLQGRKRKLKLLSSWPRTQGKHLTEMMPVFYAIGHGRIWETKLMMLA